MRLGPLDRTAAALHAGLTMRAIAVGAMLGAVATFAAAPAEARVHALIGSLSTSGGVSVTWHGSAARGCAEAGLCGYRGSTSTQPRASGQIYIVQLPHRPVDAFGSLDSEDAPVVRVLRQEPDGGSEACVDVGQAAHGSELDMLLRVRRGRARVRLEGDALDTGSCAGPDLSEVLSRLPSRGIALARLRRGNTSFDLSASVPLRSGRFSGRLVSTLRLHVGPMRREVVSEEEEPPPENPSRPRRRALFVNLHAVYRVTAFSGKVATSFHGLQAPLCPPVDACGVSGVASWAVLSQGGTLVVDAQAHARRSDHGRSGLVAAVRRRGEDWFVEGAAALRHEGGTISARVDRSGAASCRDSASVRPP